MAGKGDVPVEPEPLGKDEWFSGGEEPEYWLRGTAVGSGMERRIWSRSRIFFRILIDPDGRPADTDDISPGGMLIRTDRPVPAGRRISVSLHAPHGVERFRGLVKWVGGGSRTGPASPGSCFMGVEFEWMTLGMGGFLAGLRD